MDTRESIKNNIHRASYQKDEFEAQRGYFEKRAKIAANYGDFDKAEEYWSQAERSMEKIIDKEIYIKRLENKLADLDE